MNFFDVEKLIYVRLAWEPLHFSDGSLVFNNIYGNHLKIKNPSPILKEIIKHAEKENRIKDILQMISSKNLHLKNEVEANIKTLLKKGILGTRSDHSHQSSFDNELFERFFTQLEWLADHDLENYDGHRTFQKIRNAKIGILGLGGTGSTCAMLCAAVGMGEIRIIDGDMVENSNLSRQIFYDRKDCGKRLKAEALKSRLEDFSPFTKIETIYSFIDHLDSAYQALEGLDFLIVCADAPRILLNRIINQACVQMRIPYINAFSGLLGPIYIPNQTPCFTCLEAHLKTMLGDNHEKMVEALQVRKSKKYPSFVAGVLNMANEQFMECFRFITGISRPKTESGILRFTPSGHVLEKITKDENCVICQKKNRI